MWVRVIRQVVNQGRCVDNEGRTHSVTKYSWNRLSGVSSGWNVVRKWRPCRRATKVLGSFVEFDKVRDSGRRDGERREMTLIGGSSGFGSSERITCLWGQLMWRTMGKGSRTGARIKTPVNGRSGSLSPVTSRSASNDSTWEIWSDSEYRYQEHEERPKTHLRSPSVSCNSDRHST